MTTLLRGSCLALLLTLANNSVHAVVSDPPYELGFMGKKWDSSGIAYNVAVWQECLRVLKPGGHLLAFGGTRTHHRMTCAIEDAGFDIRDELDWIYGSGFPKSHNLKGDWRGWGTALKPAREPIVMARKPLDGTVAENVLAHGTGALNINATRLGDEVRTNAPAGNKPGGVSSQMSVTGMPQDAVTGRWASNVLLDETAAEELDTQQERVSRFFYVAKPSAKEKNAGLGDEFQEKDPDTRTDTGKGSYTTKGVAPQKNHHPTVKPITLMRYLVRLITPPGGTVLDPFNGSGSTGCAAVLERMNYIGMDLSQEYLDITRARIAAWAPDTVVEDTDDADDLLTNEPPPNALW